MLPLWGWDNQRIDERQHPGGRACHMAGSCPDALSRQGPLSGLRCASGGQGGIRTLDTGLPYTHFPGVRLRPLGHLSTKAVHKWFGTSCQGLVFVQLFALMMTKKPWAI